MKKISEFISSDMFGHIGMSGPDIVKFFDPKAAMTTEEKLAYAKGIICTYPYMMTGNYYRWKFEGEHVPHSYKEFMDTSMPALQGRVFPMLEKCFNDAKPVSAKERAEIMVPIFTDIVPFHILLGFYNYMYGDSKNAKDIKEWVDSVRPTMISLLGGVVLKAVYDETTPMDYLAKTEVFMYIATRMPYDLLKKYHDWHFGAEVVTMPPPPPDNK